MEDTSGNTRVDSRFDSYSNMGGVDGDIRVEFTHDGPAPLRRIASAFVDNMRRVLYLMLTPAALVDQKGRDFMSLQQAISVVARWNRDDAGALLYDGMGSLYEAATINLWTIVETTAVDAWEAALNCDASLVKSLASAKGSEMTAASLFDAVDQFGDGVLSHMGSVILRNRMLRLETMPAVTDAYRCAFADKTFDIFGNETTVLLERVRNLLVHRAGRVDKRYRDETKHMKPDAHRQLIGLEIGERIVLDAGDVYVFFRHVEYVGTELFRYIASRLARRD